LEVRRVSEINAHYFRWLGVGGIELKGPHQTVLIDPYLSRIPLWNLLIGHVRPRRDAVRECISEADAVLVTHSHFDHVMDVPFIARQTGANIYGSSNTCRLARISNVATEQIHEIRAGDSIELDSFRIRVLPAGHVKLPLYPPRPLSAELKLPLKALDYRMDTIYSFHVQVNDLTLLVNPGHVNDTAVAAEILLIHPHLRGSEEYRRLKELKPRTVIPIHWDNHHRPLSKPLRPWFRAPERSFRPLRHYNLNQFRRQIEAIDSGMRLFVPEILKYYNIMELINPA
jgi:L-ascorbate metabolism protein UlaG (beta-lactamase superfamily)